MQNPQDALNARPAIVVNADDLGISESVNRGILEAHLAGIVTSTSFMANMPGSEDGAARAAAAPELDVGLHFNLTEGRPLTPARSLVRRDGSFRRLPAQLAALLSGTVRFDDVIEEARAQLARARSLGIRPTHLDGHEHVHVFGAARPAVFHIAMSEGLVLRRPRVLPFARGLPAPFNILRNLLLRAGAHRGAWSSVAHPAAFFDLTSALPGLTPGDLVDRVSRCRGVVEIMCHPGAREGADPEDGLRDHRLRDLEFLRSPALKDALESAGLRVTGFARAGLRPGGGSHVGIRTA